MKSIILCEGSTDYTLLQYYMRVANGWEDKERSGFHIGNQKARIFSKKSDLLTIAATGGCENLITKGLKEVLDWNKNSFPNKENFLFEKIVIITDHDDENVETKLLGRIKNLFTEYGVIAKDIKNNVWVDCEAPYSTKGIPNYEFEILPLIIPFSENGALETFLLNSIAKENPKEAVIINDNNKFVENTFDKIKKDNELLAIYKTGRRYVTKAKFDVYFSLRTPAEQFNQRHNILKNVPWEKYIGVQSVFHKLNVL